jgi:hypothetical protein
MYWLLIGLIVVVLGFLMWNNVSTTKEHFATVDLDTATAQRQQLQFEGERRYNDLGRLQLPGGTLSPDAIDSAISQPLAKPSAGTSSLLTLISSSLGLGAGASGSRGASVEQTGAVMEKIRFCESLPLNCSTLDDPRMAECGFCHRDGIDSKGAAHRGGMYISADDTIRANERAEGGTATYQPTVGTCNPRNFTMMRDNCLMRENQLTCQSAGAPTLANQCGQCYGASPGGATGLIFVGPKPRTFTAVLVLSHPGMHNYQGTGTIVTMPDGSIINVATNTINETSMNQLINPTTVYLNNVKEGDTISIKVFGVPKVWCAWLTSPDGNRSVSIDIGLQNESANPGLVIAGDKRASAVTNAISSSSSGDATAWSTFQPQVPNTVMWYARRDEVLNGGIVSAIYNSSNGGSIDVTYQMKSFAGAYADVTVGPAAFGRDPAPGIPKNLTVTLDNGQSFNVADGSIIPKARLNNIANLQVVIPATLVDPAFPDDKADCPTGPIVFTAVGAGLMGSHSCFKPDGSFNPTAYCLQELFMAAGGTQGGADYPSTDAKAAALVVNNSLDDTVTLLNTRGSIAQYGFDSNGVAADFPTYKDASMRMLGTSPTSPCDGPNAATGPHTPECLDYLWRTAGASALPPATTDPTSLPYAYCGKGTPGAPLNMDNTMNTANINAANALGSVTAIRQAYGTLYSRTRNSANFADQNAAMQQCFGVSITPPPPKPLSCVPEVFNICPGGYTLTPDEAAAACKAAGARQATPAEIAAAQGRGANWCACGWASDGSSSYPMNKILSSYGGGCGSVGVNQCPTTAASWTGGKSCATCFGAKPTQASNPPGVLPFNNDTREVGYRMTSPGYDESDGVGQQCFDGLTVAQAQAQCTANSSCMSFSFAAAQVGTPMASGGGCFKMNHNAPFNPNPAYVGFTKEVNPPPIIVWNDPRIPRVTQMATLKNAANPANGVLSIANGGGLVIQDPSTINPQDGTFNVVAPNNGKDGYVSLQSYSTPTSYIRHSSFIGYVMTKDGSDMFNNDSSFITIPALNNDPTMFSLQSFNYPDHYLMTETNPDGSIQAVLRVPGAATANASWFGVLPLVAVYSS